MVKKSMEDAGHLKTGTDGDAWMGTVHGTLLSRSPMLESVERLISRLAVRLCEPPLQSYEWLPSASSVRRRYACVLPRSIRVSCQPLRLSRYL